MLIGYLCGCILTASAVTKKVTGKSVSQYGVDGNPGMANVMANVGFLPGLLVLIGDVLKCALASWICWMLFHEELGTISLLYANIGTTLGHCFPFWRKFKGGKGVITICAAIILYDPLWGIVASLLGAVVVLISHYLSIGGTVIPFFFIPFAFYFHGMEAGILSIILSIIAFQRHYNAMVKDLKGKGRSIYDKKPKEEIEVEDLQNQSSTTQQTNEKLH